VLPVFVYICIGYGVFATKDFHQGEFLLDYRGNFIDPVKGDTFPDQTFLYYFQLNGDSYW